MKHEEKDLKKMFHKFSERSKKISIFSVEMLLLWVLLYAITTIKFRFRFLVPYYFEINFAFIFIGVGISLLGIFEYLRLGKRDSGYYDGWLSIFTMIIGMIIAVLAVTAIISGHDFLIKYS